jgi:hypothetical protein
VSTPAPSALAARLAELERQVRDLRVRVAVLEKGTAPRKENPDDSSTVREKVTYDWQA